MYLKKARLFLSVALLGLSLAGCFNWSARATNKVPKTTALDKTYKYDGKVIIIGAGAAGLAAAKVLQLNGIDYEILEATERYGGRIKKDSLLADFPIDVGAEWIHSNPVVLNILKGKKGNEIDEELIPYHLEDAYSWNGLEYEKVSKSKLDFDYNFMPESKFKKSTWYDYIEKNIANKVKHKIKFSSAVTEIDYSKNKVIITTENGKSHKADKVLVTVSIGVLKSNKIKFIPELSQEKKESIESVSFLPGFKLIMKFDEKFYPDAINCNTTSGEKVYYDIAFKKETKTNILGLLVTGNSTKKYYAYKTEEKIVESAITELDAIFNGKASESFSGEYIIENWGQHNFTMGTWTQAFQEKNRNLKILNQPINKKIYFAGEINDIYNQMGVPGAVLSGFNSIDKLMTD
jgi:monoamine oxidase|tara:strand:+ start:71 stop:1285 length:1215 start_codon:yes stop_codon:yes gene_type:complete